MTAGIFQIFLTLDDYSKNPCDQAYFDIYVIYVIYLNTLSGKKGHEDRRIYHSPKVLIVYKTKFFCLFYEKMNWT